MLDLDEFLRRGGADVTSIIDYLGSTIGLHPGDTLMAVGSLVEGLGSCKSDLDLFLVTSRAHDALPPQDHIAAVIGRCLMDVMVLPSARVADLVGRVERWGLGQWNVTHAATFTVAERTLLHRLANGRMLFPAGDSSIDGPRPAHLDLARLKLHVARQNARTIQVDMIGYQDEGDYRSLVFAAQNVLGDAIDALLAGHHVTNPLTKWRNRLVQSLPPSWESSLPGRRTGLPAADLMWRLHRAPGAPTRARCLEHACRIVTFARRVFTWAELSLIHGVDPGGLWPGARVEAGGVRRKGREAPLPCLDLDVDCVVSGEGATLGRLNDFGQTLTMPHRDLAVCLSCDGVTTPREAARAAYGSTGKNWTRRVAALVGQLVEANLVLRSASATAEAGRRTRSRTRR